LHHGESPFAMSFERFIAGDSPSFPDLSNFACLPGKAGGLP
jgi:hypothetical protein